MVNYRRVVCEVAVVVALVAVAAAAPAPDCTEPHAHYDQRQNGTENYRVNIDGVVIAVAPAESLMSALTDIDDLLELALEEYNQDYPAKPPSSTPSNGVSVSSIPAGENKPEDVKPQSGKPDEAKPQEVKPEDAKPEEAKPDNSPLSDVSLSTESKGQKKDASNRKQEKAQRLKNRLASFLMPLLRKTRHH